VTAAALVMAKAPVAGSVKTRLGPAFTPQECAAIQAALIRRTASWAAELAPGAAYLAFDPARNRDQVERLVPPALQLVPQAGSNLGERLTNAAAAVWARGDGPLLIAGVDTRLTEGHAQAALAQLDAGADAVFGPALDGGYYLAALKRPLPELFAIDPCEWGGPRVLELTLRAAWTAGLRTALIHPERDLDTPADARALEDDPELGHLLRRAHEPLVSIVVPTLDEAVALPGLLDHLSALEGRFEVTIADGGSCDGTNEMAANHPLSPTLLHTPGGRAAQMNAGAAAAHGDLLLFLHADTRLPSGAYRSLTKSTADGGNFAIHFDGGDLFSRVLGAWYRAQRRLGIYYGDSAIWVRRRAFESLGGFRTLPIMDDYDLARRLERGFTTACLPGPVVTSARRWRALGVPRTVLSWVVIRWLFVAGVPPTWLAGLYRRAR
jgi:rSAM/selenodomain-associated transferase 2/rSAM/selenodomain-associated transferase 1